MVWSETTKQFLYNRHGYTKLAIIVRWNDWNNCISGGKALTYGNLEVKSINWSKEKLERNQNDFYLEPSKKPLKETHYSI